jgi:Ulp1 family protease
MEEIKNYLIENNYVVRVLENDLTRLVGVKVFNDKLINLYISYRESEYEATAYIHQRQDRTRKISVQVSEPVEMIKQIKSLEESCL